MLPSGRAAVIGSVLSGVAAGAAFGLPYGWVVTQTALMFLLWALASASPRPSRAAGLAAAFSVGLFATGFAGFIEGAPDAVRLWALVPWLASVALLCAAVSAATWAVCRLPLQRATRWCVAWPIAWMSIEWIASQGDMGLLWLRLGQQHAPGGPLAGLLPVGGTLLVGAAMWSSAAIVLMAARSRTSRARWVGACVGLLLVGVVGQRIDWTAPGETLAVALVQPADKTSAQHDPLAAAALMHYYRETALASPARLVLTPQLALPKTVQAVPDAYWSSLSAALTRRGADLLLGVHIDSAQGGLYNAALSLGASGTQHYLKQRLFPVGEFLPVTGAARRWLDGALPTPMRDTARGPAADAPLLLAGQHAAVFICFEAAFASLWRERAASAGMLVNLSSDSALVSPRLSRQFLQLVQARALEFAKPLLRTSDVDGTYVVDHRGQLQSALPPGERGVLSARVTLHTGLTPYARFGDALAFVVVAVAALAALLRHALRARADTASRGVAGGGTLRLRRQSGQVMLPAVALLTVCGALLYLMVNSSQAVNEKTRVTNAADAAAYSAGIVEARALNFFAYTNRAMVANQIVIAQAVSVGSWMRYFGIASQNITDAAEDVGTMFLPGSTPDEIEALRIGATFAAAEYVLEYYTGYTPNDYADLVLQQYAVIGGIVTFHNGISEALSAAQQLARANLALGIRQQDIANDIVQGMDASLSAEVVPVTHGFDIFSRAYSRNDSGGDGRGRFADVTMRSRDEFTRDRSWSLRSTDIPVIRRRGALLKRGGTDLVGFDEWRAVDTLELHGQTFGCGRFGLSWCDDIRRPIGWAGVNVNAGSGDEGAGYHGGAYRDNPTTADNADDDMEEPAYGYFTGLPTSQELDDIGADASRTTEVTLMVTKRHEHMLTSGGAAQARPSGALALFNDRPAGARMVGLSRAQVFFDRIDRRADGREEIGSLYNPYWRVRLVAPIAADRGYSATRQDNLLLP